MPSAGQTQPRRPRADAERNRARLLDAARVAFTMGRDLKLAPAQQSAPLNYLIYPYVEVDGKAMPKDSIKNHFDYADIGG